MVPSSRRQPVRRLVLLAFVFAAALSRLVPHPPNFTPLGAMALFGGAYFGSRWAAFILPVLALLISDVALELLSPGRGFHSGMPVVYGCFLATSGLGLSLRGRVRAGRVANRSLLAAWLFFLVTNFAVWAGGGLYSMSPSGLLACYVAALPFLGNTLAGHAVYGVLLFGGFSLLERRVSALAPRAV